MVARIAHTSAQVGSAVRLEAATKVYGTGAASVTALRGVTVAVPRGTFAAVMGPSGSGKSTFLHLAAGLDTPTSGRVLLGETDLGGMRETALTQLRRERIGFVFQAYNLVPALTVVDNITLPLRFAGRAADQDWLTRIAGAVGIGALLRRRPTELSGGQQQRVAIARALVTRPDVVFADEPTGALDTGTGGQVLALLREIVDTLGQTVVMVTHDPVAAAYAHTVLFLADGRLVGEERAQTAEAIAARLPGAEGVPRRGCAEGAPVSQPGAEGVPRRGCAEGAPVSQPGAEGVPRRGCGERASDVTAHLGER